jgi:hypothetical protein
MTFVLLSEGPGQLRAARVISESRRDVGRLKAVRVLTCCFAQSEISRYAETKPFRVMPAMILAEWEDLYETNSDRLNYRSAMLNLCRIYGEKKPDLLAQTVNIKSSDSSKGAK